MNKSWLRSTRKPTDNKIRSEFPSITEKYLSNIANDDYYMSSCTSLPMQINFPPSFETTDHKVALKHRQSKVNQYVQAM